MSGPSGSGKTTLAKKVLQDKSLGKFLVKSISLTTRPRRTNEKRRQDYFFVSEKDFRKVRKAKKILEWTRYLGYYYATPKDFVDKQLARGRHIVMCLDLKGVFAVKKLYPENTITIFIAPPSLRALQQRIGKRCQRTGQEEIRERLKLARKEVLTFSRYDYCLVNKNLKQAVRALKNIIVGEISIKERKGL